METHQYDTCVSKAVRTAGLSSSRRPRPVIRRDNACGLTQVRREMHIPQSGPVSQLYSAEFRVRCEVMDSDKRTLCGGVQLTAIES
jgi:hypothetical protein